MASRPSARSHPIGPAESTRDRALAAYKCPRPFLKPLDPLRQDARFTPDFKTSFPHLAWESTPAVNRDYPAGFRYRFIALRDDRAGLYLLSASIIPNGQPPLTLARYEINPSLFHATVAALLTAVSKAHDVSFTASH